MAASYFYTTKAKAFFAGAVFLLVYWLIGYDGITFSDDVYYLLAGKSFWEGTMEVNAYHFSSRWGAYVPAGFLGWNLGFEPHRISLISWISYVATLGILLKAIPKGVNPWILTLWFCTQVYLLHFLTKVYPDSLLVFWTCLVPFSAIYRNEKPILSAFGVLLGLFCGFITKETIVFLAPLPLLLFVWDLKQKNQSLSFYTWLLGFGVLFGGLYLGYFYLKFGNPLYRFESIQDGHYVSEFTYADKSAWVMLKRLTILPITTLVERAYWIWVILALPGIWNALKSPKKPGLEFSLAIICLFLGFWFMSTNFRFYNPLYLNPRHLIILVPILAYLIALGWNDLFQNTKLKSLIQALIGLGVLISLFQLDFAMAGFQLGFLLWFRFSWLNIKPFLLAILLVVPTLASIFYQQKIKDYSNFEESLIRETQDSRSPILVNNFIHFSREVLLPENQKAQELLFPIENLDSLQSQLPQEFRVFMYEYYRHAYPKEQEDVAPLEKWLEKNAVLNEEEKNGKVWVRTFQRK